MARLGAAWRAVTRSTVYNEATYGAAVFQQDRARGRNRAPFSSSPSSPMGVVRPCVRTFAMPPDPAPLWPRVQPHAHALIHSPIVIPIWIRDARFRTHSYARVERTNAEPRCWLKKGRDRGNRQRREEN